MRGVLDCNAEGVSGESTSTPPSSRCCKMILPCNTHTGKKTKPQLKYSLYWLLLRLVVHRWCRSARQWEFTNIQAVVSFLNVSWNHSYCLSHVSISKQITYQMGVCMCSRSYQYNGYNTIWSLIDTVEMIQPRNSAKQKHSSVQTTNDLLWELHWNSYAFTCTVLTDSLN